MEINTLLMTDVYKLGHMEFYPEKTEFVYSYLCARSDKRFKKHVFFGLQYYLKKYLTQPITKQHVSEFLDYRNSILGSTSKEIESKITALGELGYWPLEIKAVPEGSILKPQNVLMTVKNTVPGFGWCTCFVESLLLKVWNTMSVCTLSLELKKVMLDMAEQTGNSNLIPFQVHDFGYRGCSSEETAALSGAAHLVNFLGTDTITAVKLLKDYYNAEDPVGLSVPATEHSVMSSFGKDKEIEAFKRVLKLYPTGIVSIVSDTYNFWNVLENFTDEIKEEILNREGRVVFRPDSGDPEKIILGDPSAKTGSPEKKGALRILAEKFGTKVNNKGYLELNDKVGLIYGDGMYFDRVKRILQGMASAGFASSNLVFGIGGLLLQQHNRDDLGVAFKAIWAKIDGKVKTLYKDPITDPGKRSHEGLLMLSKSGKEYTTLQNVSSDMEKSGALKTVFKDGKLIKECSLKEVQKNLEGDL